MARKGAFDKDLVARAWPDGTYQQFFADELVGADATTIDTGTGVVTFTGFSPTVETPRTVNPDTGAITYSGFSPTLSISAVVSSDTGVVTFTGYEPTVTSGQFVAETIYPRQEPLRRSIGRNIVVNYDAQDEEVILAVVNSLLPWL